MYNSNEFLHSAGVSRHMQATGEAPSQKTSMKRRSCEVPLGDISSNNFKISLGDITNENNYDCRSIRSFKSEDTRSLRSYRPIDSRSVKNFRSSLADISAVSTFSLSRPPSYDQLSRRSYIEGPDAQGITSSIEGVLWSDEEENEYFYHENITSAWNQGERKYGDPTAPLLFKLPKTRKRLEEWLPAIGRYDLLKRIIFKKSSNFQLWLRVCEKHFEKQKACKRNNIKIRWESVPSLNVPSPRLGTRYVKNKAVRRNHIPEKNISVSPIPPEFVVNLPTSDLMCQSDNDVLFYDKKEVPNHLAPQESLLSIPVSTQLSPAHQNVMPVWSIPDTPQILPVCQNAMARFSASVPPLMQPLQTMMPSLSIPVPSQISPQTFLPVFSIPVNSQLSSAPQMTMPVLPTPVVSTAPTSQNENSAWSAVAPQISPAHNAISEFPVPADSQFLSASQTAMSDVSIPISANLSPASQNAIPAWSAPVSSQLSAGPQIALPGLSIPLYAEMPPLQSTQMQSNDISAQTSGAQTIVPALSVPISSQISPALQTVPGLSLSVTTQLVRGLQNTAPVLSSPQMSLAPNVMSGWSVPVASQLLPPPHTVIPGWSIPIPAQVPPCSLSLGGWSDGLAPNTPIFTLVPATQMNFTTPFGGLPNVPVSHNLISASATPAGFNIPIATGNIPIPTTTSTSDHPFVELTLPEIEHILKQRLESPNQEKVSDETDTIILVEDGNEGESLKFKFEELNNQ